VDDDDGGKKPRVVKRYANRKLYDTRDSRYVTLQQIAELVREGEDVRIIDNRTKEDLTDVTLAQIIYEEQKEGKRTAWSVRTLKELVQQGGDRLMTSLKDSPVVRLVTRASEEAELGDETPRNPEAPKEGAPAEPEKKGLVAKSREAWDELSRLTDDRVKTMVATAMGQVKDLQGEVKRLQARVQELEEKLVKATRRGKKDDADKGDGE
jgi:polyhydroxyalkanoate synthesis repressor PhaR